jgi:hypothetical protein
VIKVMVLEVECEQAVQGKRSFRTTGHAVQEKRRLLNLTLKGFWGSFQKQGRGVGNRDVDGDDEEDVIVEHSSGRLVSSVDVMKRDQKLAPFINNMVVAEALLCAFLCVCPIKES